ncbi:unnamed protein product, partial [Mycena citricolor]
MSTSPHGVISSSYMLDLIRTRVLGVFGMLAATVQSIPRAHPQGLHAEGSLKRSPHGVGSSSSTSRGLFLYMYTFLNL